MKSYRFVFWLLATVGLVVDLGSKYVVFSQLYNEGRGDEIEIIPEAFHIVAKFTPYEETGDGILARLRTLGGVRHVPHVNHGALFGIGGRDETGTDHNLLFALISVAAAVGIGVCSTRPAVMRDRLLTIALGLILAGTLGNFYDRIVFHGVRDFLWWHGLVNWPVFNIADCCLVCGAGTLLVQAFFLPDPMTEPMPQETPVLSTSE
jgi:signal peptidase II